MTNLKIESFVKKQVEAPSELSLMSLSEFLNNSSRCIVMVASDENIHASKEVGFFDLFTAVTETVINLFALGKKSSFMIDDEPFLLFTKNEESIAIYSGGFTSNFQIGSVDILAFHVDIARIMNLILEESRRFEEIMREFVWNNPGTVLYPLARF